MNKGDTFILTRDHIMLLDRGYVSWNSCEAGAPGIDCKRPYGNGDVPRDIAEILGWVLVGPIGEQMVMTDLQRNKAWRLHAETEIALQLLLLGYTVPGKYERTKKYDTRSWRLIELYKGK